jgi:hypothetical protein
MNFIKGGYDWVGVNKCYRHNHLRNLIQMYEGNNTRKFKTQIGLPSKLWR